MTNIKLSKIAIFLGIILFFIALSFAYFSPLLKGNKIKASDNLAWLGMSKEISDFNKETGESTLWTNSMFGGMPSYLISIKYEGEILNEVQKLFFSIVPTPAGYIAIGFICFFIMCLLLNINIWVATLGSIMWAMGTYFFILLSAGHDTKVHTLMYVPLVIGGIIAAFENKKILGALFVAFGLSFMLSANHPQMTYYSAITSICIVIAYFVDAIKNKTYIQFLKSCILLAIALTLAIGTNFGRLSTILEYGEFSTRGKSELSVSNSNNKTSGLDKSYILEYSYDFGEIMSSFIPRFKGGGMNEELGETSEIYKLLEKANGKQEAKQIIKSLPMYWGSQPISVGPFYFGAVVFFFFVLGLFLIKGREKWWIVGIVVLSLLLSLGKNFMPLSNFMLDYFPGYNKFRDVKNIIFLQHFAMVVMAMFAIRELISSKITAKEISKKILYTLSILGGICLTLIIIPQIAGNFTSKFDGNYPSQIVEAFQSDRRAMLRVDAFRSLFCVSVVAMLSWAYINKKIKAKYAIAIVTVVALIDLWSIDKKYLNNEAFISQQEMHNVFVPSSANLAILKDKDPNYRVLNISRNPFSDYTTSYFHKSIGGYHGAKMEKYQELYDYGINTNINKITEGFKTPEKIDSILANVDILNMLNTKYIIYNDNANPIYNSNALGNVWLVENCRFVNNANDEIAAINNFNVKSEAIVNNKFSEEVKPASANISKSAISLTSYKPNHLTYAANIFEGTAFAVFSEIYYPKGWNAYIDGNKVEHICANYVLRALNIPEGKHLIEFKFEPESYIIGERISFASSIILILLAFAMIFKYLKKESNVHGQ